MKLNNKGFTFVEILAVIVIIGLLTGISIAAFSRYKENAIKSDYEALARSSYNAMEEYMMSHPYDDTVSLETLEDENLLSNRKDPGAKDEDCTGTVEVSKNNGSNGKLDDGTYKVNLCCISIQKTYTYPGGTETNLTDRSKCDYVPEDTPEEPPTPPTPGTKYTLRYNDNGGSGCSSKTITKNPGEAWGSLCTPTRSGYKFNGWKNGGTTVTSSSIASGDITVVAQWSANTTPTYTVTLNNNGATTSGTGSVKVKVGDTKLPSITNPRKVVTITYINKVGATVSGGDKTKAYPLNGWYTKAAGGYKVASNARTPVLQKRVSGYTDANSKWTKKSNTTLYAQWAPVTATLPKVTKTGYTCKWTTKDGSTTSERASGATWKFSSENSRTFTAVCTANTTPTYIVTLNNNGATTTGTGSVKVKVGDTKLPSITNPRKVVTITYTNTVGATVSGGDKTKEYTLNGWYTKASEGYKVATNAGTPVLQKSVPGYTDANCKWTKKSNTTLYAQWAPVTATLPKVTKTGHTCKWTTKDGSTTSERASGGTWKFSSANARTFTAVCTANNYTLRYNDNGGSGCSSKSITKSYNTAWGTLCTPTRSGHVFNGWYDGSTKVTSTSKATKNVTVKASWIGKPTCTINAARSADSNGWYNKNIKITMTTTNSPTSYGLAKTSNSTNKVTSVTISTDGRHKYYGYVKNAAGSNTCQLTINFDKTPPTISYTYANKWHYSIDATAKDTLSGVVKHDWSGDVPTPKTVSPAKVNTPVSLGRVSGIVSGNIRHAYAWDAAGNKADKSISNYKLFDRTVTNDKVLLYQVKGKKSGKDSNGIPWVDCRINAKYGIKIDPKYNNHPYAAYDFEVYRCKCTYDYYTGAYKTNLSSNRITDSYHFERRITLFYKNNNNGVKACKGEKPYNSYIYSVCYDSDFPEGDNDVPYHGYRWYSGEPGRYKNWKPNQYYHNLGNYDSYVSASSESSKTACIRACKNAEYLSEYSCSNRGESCT